jgi:hypothetical protein
MELKALAGRLKCSLKNTDFCHPFLRQKLEAKSRKLKTLFEIIPVFTTLVRVNVKDMEIMNLLN